MIWNNSLLYTVLCLITIFDHWTVVGMNQERWMLYKINSVCTVYPKKYAHGFVVLCFVVVIQSFIMNPHEVFIHIHQGCFAGTGAIVRLPQCQWSKPDGYGKISQCITTTKHSKAKTVCIFLWIYCIWINIVVMKTERFMHIFLWKYLHFVLINASMLVSIIISLLWFWEQLGPWMGTLHFWFNLTIEAHCICFHLLSKSVSIVLLAWMLDEQICSTERFNLIRNICGKCKIKLEEQKWLWSSFIVDYCFDLCIFKKILTSNMISYVSHETNAHHWANQTIRGNTWLV